MTSLGVSYSRQSGFGSAIGNKYWIYEDYQYVDSADNEISYAVKFQIVEGCIDNLEVTNCSSKKKYYQICGYSGVVNSKIREIKENPDTEVQVVSPTKVAMASVFGSFGVALAVLAITLMIL